MKLQLDVCSGTTRGFISPKQTTTSHPCSTKLGFHVRYVLNYFDWLRTASRHVAVDPNHQPPVVACPQEVLLPMLLPSGDVRKQTDELHTQLVNAGAVAFDVGCR